MYDIKGRQYLALLQRWWWLAVASMLIAGISSYLGWQHAPRYYQSQVTVMVGQSLERLNPSAQDLYLGEQLAQNYAQLVERGHIVTAAARASGLEDIPTTMTVSARVVPGTHLLEISVVDTVPVRARVVADAIGRQLVLMTPAARELSERAAFLGEQLDDLELKIGSTEDEIEHLRTLMEGARSSRAVQDYQVDLRVLQERLDGYRSTYAGLLANTQAATNRITVLEPAHLPTKPVGAGLLSNVLLAAAIGLVLSATGAFIAEMLDDRLRSAAEAVQLTGLSLLASISSVRSRFGSGLTTVSDPLAEASQSFRILRTRIMQRAAESPPVVLVVTSPGPGEGTSEVLANLGVVSAQAGRRVLIVDADMRSASQHRLFGLPPEPGLSEVLGSVEQDAAQHVRATQISDLWLLASGARVANPDALLTSTRVDNVLQSLRWEFDLVLIDSPSATVYADAAILASRADGVLLVAGASVTQRSQLVKVAEAFGHASIAVLGLVVNHTSRGGLVRDLRPGILGRALVPRFARRTVDAEKATREPVSAPVERDPLLDRVFLAAQRLSARPADLFRSGRARIQGLRGVMAAWHGSLRGFLTRFSGWSDEEGSAGVDVANKAASRSSSRKPAGRTADPPTAGPDRTVSDSAES